MINIVNVYVIRFPIISTHIGSVQWLQLFGGILLLRCGRIAQLENLRLQYQNSLSACEAHIFTARCTLVQSAVLGLQCRPSVCPSVRLSVRDVGGSGPHRLENLETNCMDN